MSIEAREEKDDEEKQLVDPEIVAFTCNWCAYAGADYAGVSRIQYPPNVRLIRVMCSGRVEPAFVMKALADGADGVLVGGCHEADCHYISGNIKARERIEGTKQLLDLIGLGAERLRIKWVNANEGEVFAEEIKDFTKTLKKLGANPLKKAKRALAIAASGMEQVMSDTNAFLCVECGKCTASCPVARHDESFSPRATVEDALEKMYSQVEMGTELWDCLTCGICEQRCPYNVRFSDFVRDSRPGAKALGNEGSPEQSGAVYTWMRMMAHDGLQQKRLEWTEGLKTKSKATAKKDVMFFVGCLPHFDISHAHVGSGTLKIARDSVAILNALGITPVLLADERCCGHDLLYSGDRASFEQLAKRNLDAMKAAGVKRIVISCPEGYETLSKEYPKALNGWDIEVSHISELIAERLESGKLVFDKEVAARVTYQDPCRLGRYMGVYDAPRKVLSAIPGMELEEMEHHGPDAICCGVSSWVSCGATAKSIQVDRLREAKATGAEILVTACPKCQIHFRCALSGKMPGSRADCEMQVEDLTSIVARALGLEVKADVG